VRREGITEQWHDLVDGFWFIPGLVALIGPALAILCIQADYRLDRGVGDVTVPLLFGGSPSAARSILSTIAGSLITVAALVFTLTITTLQLASSQFTPRALRGFLSNRVFQVVAGVFVGIFAYCLLVLTAVRDVPQVGHGFVPALAVSVGIGLSFLGLALLLIFIHHMTQSIQVSTIAARITHDALRAIHRLPPATDASRDSDADATDLVHSWRAVEEPGMISPLRPGYVQSIDFDGLCADAERCEVRLHLTVCQGDFVVPEDNIVEVWPGDAVDEACADAMRRRIAVRDQRDITQGLGFAVRQLADIALKALSPGINDPTTAITCISYLCAIINDLVRRDLSAKVKHRPDGRTVLVAQQRTIRDYVEVFVEIGRMASTNARVAEAVLGTMAALVSTAARQGDDRYIALLREVADSIAEPALYDTRTNHDRVLLEQQLERIAQAALSKRDSPKPLT